MNLSRKFPHPLVSIIIPVYNGEKYLSTSIQSCLNQTYRKIEIIIVDDGSTDNSLSIANSFVGKDNRVTVIRNYNNKKLPATLNIGHRAANGDYITWTSDDNYYEDTAIEELLLNILRENADIVFSNFNIIDSAGSLIRSIQLNKTFSLFGNSIGASFLYRKEVFFRNNGYDENLHTVEDFDFWLQASLHSKFYLVENILYNYRLHSNSLSSSITSSNNIGFKKKLKVSYSKFLHSLNLTVSVKFIDLFVELHVFSEININDFLLNYKPFKEKISIISEIPNFDIKSLADEVDVILRANIRDFERNQNFPTILKILWIRPKLLFSYDKRRSIEIISKSLKNSFKRNLEI